MSKGHKSSSVGSSPHAFCHQCTSSADKKEGKECTSLADNLTRKNKCMCKSLVQRPCGGHVRAHACSWSVSPSCVWLPAAFLSSAALFQPGMTPPVKTLHVSTLSTHPPGRPPFQQRQKQLQRAFVLIRRELAKDIIAEGACTSFFWSSLAASFLAA